MTEEGFEGAVFDGSGTAAGFEHVHLVGVLGIDVAVVDVGYCSEFVSMLKSEKEDLDIPVSEPKLPIAQPPDQLQ